MNPRISDFQAGANHYATYQGRFLQKWVPEENEPPGLVCFHLKRIPEYNESPELYAFTLGPGVPGPTIFSLEISFQSEPCSSLDELNIREVDNTMQCNIRKP